MNTSIPQNIKRLRKQAGLTQEQMAEKLFVTRQTVSLWELGKSKPDIDTLQAIADCFQTDLTTVLYGAEAPADGEKRLLRRLVIWGIVTGVLGVAAQLVAQWASYKQQRDFSLFYGALFYWSWVIINPLWMTVCGMVLGSLIRSIAERVPWALRFLFALLCAVMVFSYFGFWLFSFSIPILSLLASRLPHLAGAFLIFGCGIIGGLPRRKNRPYK